MAASSITLLDTIEWCKRFTFLRPSAIGNFLEPAVTNANTILQTVLGAPFYWRWNRVVTGFVTQAGQQDYTLFNWTASFAVTTLFVTVDDAGNCQACTVAGTTGSSAPSWNHTKGATTTDGSVTWTNQGSIGTPVSETYSFAWIERANFQYVGTPSGEPTWKEIEPKVTLSLDSALSHPAFVAAEMDDGNGNYTFRLMPVPDQSYPVALTLQKKPILFNANTTGINQTWAPIPDEYSHIYNWGLLALLLLFADDPRFGAANQKFVAALLSTHQGLTQTEINAWLNNWQSISGAPVTKGNTIQQGFQGRAAI